MKTVVDSSSNQLSAHDTNSLNLLFLDLMVVNTTTIQNTIAKSYPSLVFHLRLPLACPIYSSSVWVLGLVLYLEGLISCVYFREFIV